jgi:hypothetical protein
LASKAHTNALSVMSVCVCIHALPVITWSIICKCSKVVEVLGKSAKNTNHQMNYVSKKKLFVNFDVVEDVCPSQHC